MSISINSELRFDPEQISFVHSDFTKPSQISRWVLCDLSSKLSINAVTTPPYYAFFLLKGCRYVPFELLKDVSWSPSINFVTSSLSFWMSSQGRAWSLVGIVSAASGAALFASALGVPVLQVVGIALMSLAVLVVCGCVVLKTVLIAARILKLDRNIQWLQKQTKAQSELLRYYHRTYQFEEKSDCENSIQTIASLFALSANRKAMHGCKIYRELLIQSLADHVIAMLLVTSIVLFCIFGGVFGLTALPTLVMGGMIMICVIGCMVASIRTISSLIEGKGHKCKQLIQQSWEQSIVSEDLLRDPETVLTDSLSVLGDFAQQPVFLSLCMRLLKGQVCLTPDEIKLFKFALKSIDHLLIDTKVIFRDLGVGGWEDDSFSSISSSRQHKNLQDSDTRERDTNDDGGGEEASTSDVSKTSKEPVDQNAHQTPPSLSGSTSFAPTSSLSVPSIIPVEQTNLQSEPLDLSLKNSAARSSDADKESVITTHTRTSEDDDEAEEEDDAHEEADDQDHKQKEQ